MAPNISEAEARPKVVGVQVAFGGGISVDAGESDAAVEVETGDLDGERRGRVEAPGDAIVALVVRRFEFIPDTEIEGEPGGRFPGVLDEGAEILCL